MMAYEVAAAVKAHSILLKDGVTMPPIGLGTFQGSYDCDYSTVVKMVKSAIDNGYRHIDTAAIYNTEIPVGEAIKAKIDEGVVKREDLFVTTKLWCTGHRREDVVPHLRKSLKKLGLDYVDNFLIHWPIAMPPSEENFPKDKNGAPAYEDTDNAETWKGMEECKEIGLTRTIGISNFNKRQIQNLLDNCTIKPTNMQIEVNPFLSNVPLAKYCKKQGIKIVCYSPLGKPSRTWETGPECPYIFTDPAIKRISESRKRTPAQVVLRWLLQRGFGVVPKSNSPERQRQNLDLYDFELHDSDMASMGACNRDFRVLKLPKLADAKEYPFSDEY